MTARGQRMASRGSARGGDGTVVGHIAQVEPGLGVPGARAGDELPQERRLAQSVMGGSGGVVCCIEYAPWLGRERVVCGECARAAHGETSSRRPWDAGGRPHATARLLRHPGPPGTLS